MFWKIQILFALSVIRFMVLEARCETICISIVGRLRRRWYRNNSHWSIFWFIFLSTSCSFNPNFFFIIFCFCFWWIAWTSYQNKTMMLVLKMILWEKLSIYNFIKTLLWRHAANHITSCNTLIQSCCFLWCI